VCPETYSTDHRLRGHDVLISQPPDQRATTAVTTVLNTYMYDISAISMGVQLARVPLAPCPGSETLITDQNSLHGAVLRRSTTASPILI
jgi:hypothetical protein